MKVINLRDKLNTGIKFRIDDLSIREFVNIELLIEWEIQEQKKFLKSLDNNFKDELDFEKMKKDTLEKIKEYETMVNKMKQNVEIRKLDCWAGDVENKSFEDIIKKYKKLSD